MNLSESVVACAFVYLAVVGVALSIIDFRTHRLPNLIVLPSYGVGIFSLGIAALLSGNATSFLRAIIGMVVLFTIYLVMALPQPRGIGMGDVKLAGLLGLYLAWLGWGSLAVGFFAAFLVGGVVSVGLLVFRRATRSTRIPFGPWMIVGAVAGALWGNRVASGYLELVGFAA